MKTIVIALALYSVVASARADLKSEIKEKQAKAYRECNSTIPVQSDPEKAVDTSIWTGKPIQLSQQENCFLHCVLQKVGFLDENANIKSPEGFVNFTLTAASRFAPYSDVVIAQVFQTARSTKEIEDKCLKAFTTYYQITQTYFVLEVAVSLDKQGVQKQILKAIEKGQPVDEKFVESVKLTLALIEMSISYSLNKN